MSRQSEKLKHEMEKHLGENNMEHLEKKTQWLEDKLDKVQRELSEVKRPMAALGTSHLHFAPTNNPVKSAFCGASFRGEGRDRRSGDRLSSKEGTAGRPRFRGVAGAQACLHSPAAPRRPLPPLSCLSPGRASSTPAPTSRICRTKRPVTKSKQCGMTAMVLIRRVENERDEFQPSFV